MILHFCAAVRVLLQSAAAIFLSGASCAEEMDEYTAERFEQLASHPIRLNTASKAKLRESGLFTPFQIASLLDYRERSGDILSYWELATLDGWGKDFAFALREFTDLSNAGIPGKSSARKSFFGDAALRYGSSSYLTKAQMQWNDRWDLFLSSKKDEPLNISAAYYGTRHLSKIIAGNFNARFGQGLTLWSGTTLSGLNTVESLCRRESALSLSTSASKALRGIATEIQFGRICISGAAAVEENKTSISLFGLANVSYLWKSGQAGLTAVAAANRQVVSGNWRIRLGKTDFYGEAAWDIRNRAPAAIIGIRGDPQWQTSWAVDARYYSPSFEGHWSGAPRSSGKTSDEAGICAAIRHKWISLSADGLYRPGKELWQTKAQLQLSPEFKGKAVTHKPCIKYDFRWKNAAAGLRNELRLQYTATIGNWQSTVRYDCVHCRSFAHLAYAEAGCSCDRGGAFLRGGVFDVKNWDDRIYVYERDVPGSFNVPARYGKGLSLSLTGNAKFTGHEGRVTHKINLRTGAILYAQSTGKTSKFEWRIQYAVKW